MKSELHSKIPHRMLKMICHWTHYPKICFNLSAENTRGFKWAKQDNSGLVFNTVLCEETLYKTPDVIIRYYKTCWVLLHDLRLA